MKDKFVPDGFIVPVQFETERFRMRMLSAADVEKDYEAVMSSREHLHSMADPEDDDEWPEEDMTIEEDLKDLQRHEDDFVNRRAFVYTVVTIDESLCLGCVYIYPSEAKGYAAEVYLWARQSELANGLEDYLYREVKAWMQKWPFEQVVFPGRDMSWTDWRRKLG